MLSSGLRITANRLFGPPPRNATYLCLWDFEIGAVRGFCSPTFLFHLNSVQKVFGVNFADAENAPAAYYSPPLDPDGEFITCVPVRIFADWSLL
jgi:hypothetical protein